MRESFPLLGAVTAAFAVVHAVCTAAALSPQRRGVVQAAETVVFFGVLHSTHALLPLGISSALYLVYSVGASVCKRRVVPVAVVWLLALALLAAKEVRPAWLELSNMLPPMWSRHLGSQLYPWQSGCNLLTLRVLSFVMDK